METNSRETPPPRLVKSATALEKAEGTPPDKRETEEEVMDMECVTPPQGAALMRPNNLRRNISVQHVEIEGSNFILDRFYTPPHHLLGRGAYGIVISALNTKTNTGVAIKKIPHMFREFEDAVRILREVRVLRHCRPHPNIITLRDIIMPNRFSFRDLYLVFDKMDTDLHSVIKSRQDLSDLHIQWFMYQLLSALQYMHAAGIIHRDIKPQNMLVTADCTMKLCDFGLARRMPKRHARVRLDVARRPSARRLHRSSLQDFAKKEPPSAHEEVAERYSDEASLTKRVVTRWYRAPEIMLSLDYDKGVDMWAAGCVLAEMLQGKPLFPGHDYLNQTDLILKFCGTPPMKLVTNLDARRYIKQHYPHCPANMQLRRRFPHASAACLDLLHGLLEFNPKKRLRVGEALKHPYFSQLHNEMDNHKILPDKQFDDTFERILSKDRRREVLRSFLWEDIAFYRPIARRHVRPHSSVIKPNRPKNCEMPGLAEKKVNVPLESSQWTGEEMDLHSDVEAISPVAQHHPRILKPTPVRPQPQARPPRPMTSDV